MSSPDLVASSAGHLRVPRDEEALDRLATEFSTADPFPHVVLHDVIEGVPEAILADAPGPEWNGWTSRFRNRYQREKYTCDDIEALTPPLAQLLTEMQSPRFLEFLVAVTGIPKLIPDPYLHGGGLHMTGPGGVLEPHTDFHVYDGLGLFRQVNALLYLNPVWDEQWGGCLELFAHGNDEEPAQRILPSWGTLVVFRTDDRSFHGFPRPVAEGHWRRSIATYYYTAQERESYHGDAATYWMPRAATSSPLVRTRLAAYRALVAGQRMIAHAAAKARPSEPPTVITPPLRDRRLATQRDDPHPD